MHRLFLKRLLTINTIIIFLLSALSIYGQGTIKGMVSDSLTFDQPADTVENKTPLAGQSKSQAEEIKREVGSNTIENVIAGEKLQDMSDENIPVTLSRLPGISIMYNSVPVPFETFGWGFAGPGPYITSIPQGDFTLPEDPVARVLIRGLDAGYYNITINGIRIPPASAIDKSMVMNNLSQRDFQNIEVHKTITSDEDADATAGAINMIAGKAPKKSMIKVEALGNYNKLDNSRNQYNFIGSYGERFFNDKFGIRADAHIDQKIMSNESQNTSTNFAYYNSSYTNAVRKRNGADILLDYLTPDGGSITFFNIFNKTNTDNFKSEADSSMYGFNLNPELFFTEKKTEQELFLSSLGGSNHLFGFDVDWKAAFSESRDNHPYNYTLSFRQYSDFFTGAAYGPFFLDHAFDIPAKSYGKEKTVSLDIHKKYALSSEITGELKFGGKYRINSRSYFENSHLEITNHVGLSYFKDSPPGERIGLGNYPIPLINKDSLISWHLSNLSQYDTSNGADINSYNWSQSVSAAYIMHSFNFSGFAIFITGLRIENELNDYSGYSYPYTIQEDYPRPPGSPIVVVSQDILYNELPEKTRTFHYSKTSILPNLQMILKPTGYMNLRLAAYKTLIRPPAAARVLKYIAISSQSNAGLAYLNMGNPDLKNADVWNYEFQLQFHGNDIGQLTFDAFYKEIDGMVQATNGMELADSNEVKSLGINWRNYIDQFPLYFSSIVDPKVFNVFSYYNSPKPTHIWGFEFSHQANFRYLPGLLKNIVLNYNFTFLRSEAWTNYLSAITFSLTRETQITLTDKDIKLRNIPDFFANANLGYDIDGFSFRISYFYRDEYQMDDNIVKIYSSSSNPPIKRSKYSRLDIAVRQRILKHIFINLNLNNITNSKEEAIIKYPRYMSYYPNGQTAQAYLYGMNIDFGIGVEL